MTCSVKRCVTQINPGDPGGWTHQAPVPRSRRYGHRGADSRKGVMAHTATTGKGTGTTRLDRRKARTRQALIDAAVGLIAEGRGERASIQEITEAADIGFGSFYNHFESKDELFRTASEEVLERWGQMIDGACAGLDDPADVFATSFRITGRLS